MFSIRQQCSLLQLPRSTYYYQAAPDTDKTVMDLIDEIYTDLPEYGSPRMTAELKRRGLVINHKKVARLMRLMGLTGQGPGPNTSVPHPEHVIFPYLLRGVKAQYPNHIWGTDITYIRLLSGFAYLVAILDWFSRYVVAWTLSPTLEAAFCVENLAKALTQARPDIHNSDQGTQFTSQEYLAVLQSHPEVRISMDGRGSFWDNIMTERLWRTVKYNEVYVHDYQSFREADESMGTYLKKYNERRLCSAIGNKPPAEIYFAG